MAHLRAKFHGYPTKTVEKLMFRAAEEYVYDSLCIDIRSNLFFAVLFFDI